MAGYERVDVSDWKFAVEETAGRSEKVWLVDPADSEEPRNRWLFKPVTIHKDGSIQCGDLSEKIAAEVASLLGVPSAEIRLAKRAGRDGSLSRNIRPRGYELHSGHVWMSASPDVPYPGLGWVNKGRAAAGYSLRNVLDSLRDIGAPPESKGAIRGAQETFVSYLALDAIIANADRHENNWGILRPIVGDAKTLLAPAYDNENSLGYQLPDAHKTLILDGAKSGGVEGWATRGQAVRFHHTSEAMPDLVAFAANAIKEVGTQDEWEQKLGDFEFDLVEEMVSAIPQMSSVARTFAVKLTHTNIERLRHAIRDA
ncbi:HipA domain-containing protein [Salinibacterium soli]|uniref:HipA domain-containing protein n=1 Tax=Antiquaquibacter soli TaxID=3064523 RepID=A0ABT9BMK6_9MICO|nr:HipA domain-containing protein [Protaetiibacter sp. WY-16]MDO7880645.1 HipA domain-containing protein [Protaetiibacter sp. WY-16]